MPTILSAGSVVYGQNSRVEAQYVVVSSNARSATLRVTEYYRGDKEDLSMVGTTITVPIGKIKVKSSGFWYKP